MEQEPYNQSKKKDLKFAEDHSDKDCSNGVIIDGNLATNFSGEALLKTETHRVKGEDRSSVAWFKLAELVSRGEKEKALTLYRLLSHSFEERGYVLQVEGDLLWAFEDSSAIERYKQAAFLYKKEKKLTAAVAVYEHLFMLQPKNYDFLVSLIEFYVRLDWEEKFKDRFKILLDLFWDNQVSLEKVWAVSEVLITFLKERDEIEKNKGSNLFKALTSLLDGRIPELSTRARLLYKGKNS